jgi:hypothetical protein
MWHDRQFVYLSVSLASTLALVCVDHRARILKHFRRVLILGVVWSPDETGVPLLADVLATLECSRVNVITAGDHLNSAGRGAALHQGFSTIER